MSVLLSTIDSNLHGSSLGWAARGQGIGIKIEQLRVIARQSSVGPIFTLDENENSQVSRIGTLL